MADRYPAPERVMLTFQGVNGHLDLMCCPYCESPMEEGASCCGEWELAEAAHELEHRTPCAEHGPDVLLCWCGFISSECIAHLLRDDPHIMARVIDTQDQEPEQSNLFGAKT